VRGNGEGNSKGVLGGDLGWGFGVRPGEEGLWRGIFWRGFFEGDFLRGMAINGGDWRYGVEMKEYLVICSSVELTRVASEEIAYISADGNYSLMVFTYGVSRMVTIQLGQVERLLEEQLPHTGGDFIRIGKSLIINKRYISYINLTKQQLVLTDGQSAGHTLTASKEALKQLKTLIEKGAI